MSLVIFAAENYGERRDWLAGAMAKTCNRKDHRKDQEKKKGVIHENWLAKYGLT